jgi:hypothetical protein
LTETLARGEKRAKIAAAADPMARIVALAARGSGIDAVELAAAAGCSVIVPRLGDELGVERVRATLRGARLSPPRFDLVEGEIVEEAFAAQRDRRVRRRLARRRREGERFASCRRAWAAASSREIDAPMAAQIAPETRGECLELARDAACSKDKRRARELATRLPLEQARILLDARERFAPWLWCRMVACAWATWRTSRRARASSGCARIVDGVPRGAYRFAVVGPDASSPELGALWRVGGPMLLLAQRTEAHPDALELFTRRQPPVADSRYKGIARIDPRTGAVLQFAVGQSRYARSHCGRSLWTLAQRGNVDALALMAKHCPWLVDRREDARAAVELASSLHAPPVELVELVELVDVELVDVELVPSSSRALDPPG